MKIRWTASETEGEIAVEDEELEKAYEAGGLSAVNGLIQYRADEYAKANLVAVPEELTNWKGKR